MTQWSTFPHPGEYRFDVATVRQHWRRLHAGDAEPLPSDPDVLAAWALLHSGEFQKAAEAGLQLGPAGTTLANKATCVYANYLENKEKARLDLFQLVAHRAEAQTVAEPDNPNAWFWRGYALGRFSQGISVARALAQGLGSKVKESLERAVVLQPRHADAHLALGTFHAEVIDKVGSLIGSMTYGASKQVGLKMFQLSLQLHPESAIGRIEYANGLLMLEGQEHEPEANRLYEQAAAMLPLDAVERLQVDFARAELLD